MEACLSKMTREAGNVENGVVGQAAGATGCDAALGLEDRPRNAGTSDAAPRGKKLVRERAALKADFNIGTPLPEDAVELIG